MASTVLMVASLALGAMSYMDAQDAREEQSKLMREAADRDRMSQGQQKAANAQAAAEERRKQIREERVRRARIMQSAENTGTAGSSGESGALSSLGTNLSANLGSNLGALQSSSILSDLGQQSADFTFAANKKGMQAQESSSMFQLSASLFKMSM